MSTGYVYHPIYLQHETGEHPERPDRLTSIHDALRGEGLLDLLQPIEPREATLEELLAVHTEQHVRYVEQVARSGGGYMDPDTVVSTRSYDAALMAAGGAIRAVEAVLDGKVSNAMALVRPPGHHATTNRAMGFCLFNNVAVAARAVQKTFGLGRILIADFDVHHGNGTQDAFQADDSVLYYSTHEYPHYPGTGFYDETGTGKGEGYTVNVPLPAGVGDHGYRRAFEEILVPVARRFGPELIIVSAGYDAHWADPLAMMQLTVTGFGTLAGVLKSLAAELCGGKIVACLEGGYHLRALAYSVVATLSVFMGHDFDDPLGSGHRSRAEPDIDALLTTIRRIHKLG
ncbi:MAG: histone deacetylase [Chloroflexi bacterium]|nr:histone deacetylase [Chloroflexota bacterium]